MEAEWLASRLEEGRSIESIAREARASRGAGTHGSPRTRRPARSLRGEPSRRRSCASAPCTAGPPSSGSAPPATAVGAATARPSANAGDRSRPSLFAKPAGRASSVATADMPARCSSIMSTRQRSPSASRLAASRARWPGPARRWRSACCCARTATPKSRVESLPFRFRGLFQLRPDLGRSIHRSGVIQWQNARLLTESLWVRVPPPEYEARTIPPLLKPVRRRADRRRIGAQFLTSKRSMLRSRG